MKRFLVLEETKPSAKEEFWELRHTHPDLFLNIDVNYPNGSHSGFKVLRVIEVPDAPPPDFDEWNW